MKNKKSKISFDRSELEQFLNDSELVIKENTLKRVQGGESNYNNWYVNENYYAKSTFVNNIYANRIG